MSDIGPVETGIRGFLVNDFVADELMKALKSEWNVVEECDHVFAWAHSHEMCQNDGCFTRYGEVNEG
jgi:hypothetical protein